MSAETIFMSTEEKKRAAIRAVAEIRDGMLVGLGSGSTASHAVREVGRRIADEGLRLTATASSSGTERLALAAGITIRPMNAVERLDLVIDGADEIDPALRAIKGGGGALFREKVLAAAADRMIVIVDSGKPVAALGRFPLPVEVHPFALASVRRQLQAFGGSVTLRGEQDGRPFLTDQQANILDLALERIDDADALAARLAAIPGVLAHGLFLDLVDTVMIGRGNTVETIDRPDLNSLVR